MSENFPKTHFESEPEKIAALFTNPSEEITRFSIIADDLLMINSKTREENVAPGSRQNVLIASFVTCHARLKLYEALELLGEDSLYCDTDAIVGIEPPDRPINLPIGDFLGQYKDEVEGYGPGSFIRTFVSGGPKNYAAEICVGGSETELAYICKVRGITLNHLASQSVNFNEICRIVLGEDPDEEIHIPIPRKIARIQGYQIVTRPESKIYRLVYTKRRRVPDTYDTLPYGYRKV